MVTLLLRLILSGHERGRAERPGSHREKNMTAGNNRGVCMRARGGPGAWMGLANQRTMLHRAPGGSEADCPGWQENGAKVQEKVACPSPKLRPVSKWLICLL